MSETSPLLKVARKLAPKMLERGQGYERVRIWDALTVEVAWYREDDWRWMLSLAIETDSGRVETPPDTSFECSPGLEDSEYVNELAACLEAQFRVMLVAGA